MKYFFKKYYLPFSLIIFFGIYLFLGISTLGNFQTADEDLWFSDPTKGRVHQYWEAMEAKDWAKTRINDKPGVSSAIFSGIFGLRNDIQPENKMFKDGNIIDQYNANYSGEAVFYYRLGILLVNGILVFFICWFLWASTKSSLIAFFSSAFLYLSPILLGISQIVNPDSMLWSFGIASATGFLAFLVRGKWYYLLFSGVFFGFVLLSKYTGSFLFFILFGMMLASFYYFREEFEEKKLYRNFVLWRLFGFLLYCALGVAIFLLLMPAAQLEPKYLYEATFNFKGASNMTSILFFMAGTYALFFLDTLILRSSLAFFLFKKLSFLKGVPSFFVGIILVLGVGFSVFNWNFDNYFHIPEVPFDAGKEKVYADIFNQWHKIALQIKAFVFTTPPSILFLSLLPFFIPLRYTNSFFETKKEHNAIRLILSIFGALIILFFFAAMQQNVLVHVRYSILLYPASIILASISLTLILSIIAPKSKIIASFIGIIVVIFASYSLYSIQPYYFNYTSDLLPKDQNVVGAWGYGGYDAAQYIKQQHLFPEYLLVWADYDGFCPFFPGKCIQDSVVKWHKKGTFEGIDYFVVSRRGLMRNKSTWNKLQEMQIMEPKPVWSLYIGDRPGNFVEVYRAKDFSSKK